jgi:hypothetical protein
MSRTGYPRRSHCSANATAAGRGLSIVSLENIVKIGLKWIQPSVALATAVLTCVAAGQTQPPVVTPGLGGLPPSDAVILFDGKDLSHWVHKDGRPAEWTVKGGAMVCNTGTGNIYSREKFGSAQIHVEFAIPLMPQAKGQARGNSGVYLQGRYELQVLDSYKNPTYPDGSAGALYGQHAPLVNASRPPEEWQAYDVVFHAPACNAGGTVSQPGTLTVFYNGVLIQDHATIKGITSGGAKDNPCADGALMLQDHVHPDVRQTFMRFRNIWYRSLDQDKH